MQRVEFEQIMQLEEQAKHNDALEEGHWIAVQVQVRGREFVRI